MNKKQFIKTYKPSYSTHKNGSKITRFEKDSDGNYPLSEDVKKYFNNREVTK